MYAIPDVNQQRGREERLQIRAALGILCTHRHGVRLRPRRCHCCCARQQRRARRQYY